MAKKSAFITESLQKFLTALRQRLPQIQAVYLYGSQVRDTATAWSDIDVAVVSSAFGPDLFQARLMLLRLAAEIDDRIEPTPFTPETFTPSDPLASEIQRTGVRLA